MCAMACPRENARPYSSWSITESTRPSVHRAVGMPTISGSSVVTASINAMRRLFWAFPGDGFLGFGVSIRPHWQRKRDTQRQEMTPPHRQTLIRDRRDFRSAYSSSFGKSRWTPNAGGVSRHRTQGVRDRTQGVRGDHHTRASSLETPPTYRNRKFAKLQVFITHIRPGGKDGGCCMNSLRTDKPRTALHNHCRVSGYRRL